jgi:hypothetical protein
MSTQYRYLMTKGVCNILAVEGTNCRCVIGGAGIPVLKLIIIISCRVTTCHTAKAGGNKVT